MRISDWSSDVCSSDLASVGLGEDTAREKGLEFRVNCQQTAGWYANRRVNEKAAGFKVLIERQSGRILGAHLLGPQADELINVFALAMRADLTADDLREESGRASCREQGGQYG